MKIGHTLGWLNSKVILGLVFLIILQPTAFIMKLSKYDPLRKNKSNHQSYRENIKNKKINLTRIF